MQLFETRCLQCHDGKKSRGGLDLSTRAKLLRGGESGPPIEPRSSARSLLLRLVRHEQEPNMPRQGKKLSDEHIALLAAWIDAGAPYDRTLGKSADDAAWWSLQPVKKPTPPTVEERLGEVDDVHPVPRPALAVVWAGEEAVNDFFDCVVDF